VAVLFCFLIVETHMRKHCLCARCKAWRLSTLFIRSHE